MSRKAQRAPEFRDGAAPRILIARIGAMGDVLHALPAVAALRAAVPDAHIGWAVEPRWLPLLTSFTEPHPRDPLHQPLVDAIHPVSTRQWKKEPFSLRTLRSVAALRGDLCAERYDLALDLQGSIRSAVISSFTGAAITLGREDPRERPARFFYDRRVQTVAPHVVPQGCELAMAALSALKIPQVEPLQPAAPLLPFHPEAESAMAALHLPERTALIAPTAGWGAKQWPAELYGELAAALAARGWFVVLNAATAEDATALAVFAAAEKAGAAGQIRILPSTLPELIALTRLVRLVVGGDTGPIHLSAALGVPTVALFGPTDPVRTGPWPAGASVVRTMRHPESVIDHRRHTATEAGLARITVSEVLAAIDSLRSEGA